MHATTTRHSAPLRRAFGLDGLAFAALVMWLIVTGGHGRRDDGFLSDPLPDSLALLALVAAIAGGGVAAWALVRDPPQARLGRWALGRAIAFVISLPVVDVLTEVLDLKHAVSVPLYALVLGGAIVLGARAHEPGRRGLLFTPLLIGASAVIFFLGDLFVPSWPTGKHAQAARELVRRARCVETLTPGNAQLP
jgi:hypothetical protein